MHKAMLLVPMSVFLALEVYHLARRGGWRFSLTFFAGVFAYGIIRANALGFAMWLENAQLPYAMGKSGLKLGFSSLTEPFGWAFALYGSWFIAEGMLRRTKRWDGEVFPVVFLSALLMGGFSYAVEAAATPMGWWHWAIGTAGNPFVYAVPHLALLDWGHVAVDFLLGFLFAECTKYRQSKWRYFAFWTFGAHILTHVFPDKVGQMGWVYDPYHWGMMWALGVAGLFWPLKLESPGWAGGKVRLWGGGRIDWIPGAAVSVMLLICLYAALVVSGDWMLLLTIAPLGAAVLVAVAGVPAALAAAAAAVGSYFHPYSVLTLLPAGSAWLYGRRFLHTRTRAATVGTIAVLAAGLALYVPWAQSMRLQYSRVEETLKASQDEIGRGDYPAAIAQQKAGFRLMCKYAASEEVLAEILRMSWLIRDREDFDFAARELRKIKPACSGARALWDERSEKEFDVRLARMRGRRERGAPRGPRE